MSVPVRVLLAFALFPSVPSPLGKGLHIHFLAQGKMYQIGCYDLGTLLFLFLFYCATVLILFFLGAFYSENFLEA